MAQMRLVIYSTTDSGGLLNGSDIEDDDCPGADDGVGTKQLIVPLESFPVPTWLVLYQVQYKKQVF